MPQQLASTDGSPPPALHCADQPLWKSTRGMKKGFVADDKFSDIIIALERRGWTRSKNASSPNFQLKWRNLSNINFRLVRADQFVNHVCNSQQLSNKALLTGHLAFRHDHAHAHARHFSEDSSAKSGADSACTGVSSKCLQGSRCCGCAGVPDGEASGRGGSGPEAFFPRCWDVRDGGVASLLKAFAVSAAAALLRRAVEADENGLTDDHRGNDKSGAASLAASISVIDRYVAALRTPLPPPPPPPPPLPPTPLARKNEPPHLRGRANDTCRGSSRCARGQDAADAVINVGDPEFSTVLTAWEAVVAKEGGNGDGKEGEEEEAGGRGDQGENEKEEEEGPTHNGTGSAQCIDSCARREMKSTRNVGASAHRTSPPCSLAGRAREALRALDTADPQSALLGAANAWVVKPAGLSCGRGVVAASSLRGLVLACHRLRWNAVVQKYVERPLLVQGFKFDIRQWVLVTSCNPLVLWGFDESYVRFSSRPFSMDASSLSDRLVHLCNHSVQKEREGFVAGAESESTPLSPSTGMPPWNGGEAHHAQKGGEDGDGNSTRESGGDAGWNDEGLPSGSRGNMWTADQLRRHLEDRFQGRDVFRDVVLPRIRSVVVQTLLGVREELEMKGRALEWLGFDLMVTEDLRVMLIEVNVSPDVSHSTPVTARLVPAATDDALRLLLDDGEADARVAAAAAASVASLDGTQPPPLPSRRRPRLPSLSELENSGATSLAPSPKPTAATTSVAAAAVAGSPAHRDCAVGRREGETGVDEGLRWRLWHKGEEESRAALRSLQDKKKAWLEARRQKRRWRCPQEEQRRTHDDPGDIHADGNCSDVDDERQALAIVDSIIKTASIKAEAEAARAAAATGAVAAGAVATAAAAAATEAGAVAAAAAAEAEAEATFSHATSLSSPSVARASWLTASPRRMGKSSIRRSATAAPVPASAVPARANVSTGSCRGNSSSSSRSCVDGATETLCTKAEGLFIGLDGPRSGVGRFFAATRGSRGQGVEEEQDEDEL